MPYTYYYHTNVMLKGTGSSKNSFCIKEALGIFITDFFKICQNYFFGMCSYFLPILSLPSTSIMQKELVTLRGFKKFFLSHLGRMAKGNKYIVSLNLCLFNCYNLYEPIGQGYMRHPLVMNQKKANKELPRFEILREWQISEEKDTFCSINICRITNPIQNNCQ